MSLCLATRALAPTLTIGIRSASIRRMQAKPYLLLDVDGVLCPFRGEDVIARALGRRSEAEFPGYEYNRSHYIHVARTLNGDRIRRLMKSYEIIWCTGWDEDANDVISPLHDLPQFPVVPGCEDDEMDSIHWKQSAIEAYVPSGMPYAFIDDDIDDRGVLYGASRSSAPSLWLPTKCYEGLTDTHVEALEGFAYICDHFLRAALS